MLRQILLGSFLLLVTSVVHSVVTVFLLLPPILLVGYVYAWKRGALEWD